MSATPLQEKVSRLLSRQKGRPALKAVKPLVLKNEVANRKLKKGEATCVTEMSLLMACWKLNDFNNAACSQEVSAFFSCAAKAQSKKQETQGSRLLPKDANTLIKRFPNQCNEV